MSRTKLEHPRTYECNYIFLVHPIDPVRAGGWNVSLGKMQTMESNVAGYIQPREDIQVS